MKRAFDVALCAATLTTLGLAAVYFAYVVLTVVHP